MIIGDCPFHILITLEIALYLLALLRMTRFAADLTPLERREVDAFARGNKGFEFCFVSLQRFVMERIVCSQGTVDDLLISKAVQNRPWQRLLRAGGDEGRRQLLGRLRQLVARELDQVAGVDGTGPESGEAGGS